MINMIANNSSSFLMSALIWSLAPCNNCRPTKPHLIFFFSPTTLCRTRAFFTASNAQRLQEKLFCVLVVLGVVKKWAKKVPYQTTNIRNQNTPNGKKMFKREQNTLSFMEHYGHYDIQQPMRPYVELYVLMCPFMIALMWSCILWSL